METFKQFVRSFASNNGIALRNLDKKSLWVDYIRAYPNSSSIMSYAQAAKYYGKDWDLYTNPKAYVGIDQYIMFSSFINRSWDQMAELVRKTDNSKSINIEKFDVGLILVKMNYNKADYLVNKAGEIFLFVGFGDSYRLVQVKLTDTEHEQAMNHKNNL